MFIESAEIAKYIETNEQLLMNYRMQVHENKNKLLMIKSMLHGDTHFLEEYLNLLLEQNEETEEQDWFSLLEPIPIPSLKIFLNHKLLKLQKKGATIELIISDELKQLDVTNLTAAEYNNICTILGVLLDNMTDAIEEEQEKLVSIYFYKEKDSIHGEFANFTTSKIDLEKIMLPGYSTKGQNHGVGLSLVNQIIETNSTYMLHTNIFHNFFVQHISKKMTQKM